MTRLILHIIKGVILTVWYSGEFHDGIPSDKYQSIKQEWLKRACSILKLEVRQHGTPLESPALYVSNHISWLDIPLVGSQAPVNFLSKDEVRSWPVVGWLTKQSGTLFIKRGIEGAEREAREQMLRNLDAGQHILIFPEGTTTDGTGVKRFLPRLFAVAIEQETHVQPVAIRYSNLQGEPSQTVPFINNAHFLQNLWQVLGEPGIRADIYFLPPITGTSQLQRKALAEETRNQISSTLAVSRT